MQCAFADAFVNHNDQRSFGRHRCGITTPQDEKALHLVLGGTSRFISGGGTRRMYHGDGQIRPFSLIRTNTVHLVPRGTDRYGSEISSSLVQDSELLTQNIKTATDEYCIIPDNQRERKRVKPGKRNANKRPSPSKRMPSTTTGTTRQPEWVLQFSAAQQQMDQFKRKVQKLVEEPIVECTGAALILLSSVLVAVTTLPDLPYDLLAPMEMVQQVLAYFFFAEFLTRWLSCNEQRGGYFTQPLVLVDIVVVVLPLLLTNLPLPDTALVDYVSGQSALINLRLLRLLRLQRVLKDEMTFSKFVSAVRLDRRSSSTIVNQWELQLARVILSIFTLLSVAAGLIYTTEHMVNPNIDDYFTALYFTLTTLTTGTKKAKTACATVRPKNVLLSLTIFFPFKTPQWVLEI